MTNPACDVPHPVSRLEDLDQRPRKVYILSLGCPKNLVDTERYLSVLSHSSYSLVSSPEEADLLFINTCGFIDEAKRESLDSIEELSGNKRNGQSLAVAGCLVDRYRKELEEEIPEVDLWLGTGDFRTSGERITAMGGDVMPGGFIPLSSLDRTPESGIPWAGFGRVSLTPPHTAYLKISEGCDHRCSFCAIPSFKGRHRSVPFDSLLKEARALVNRGARELTLIGQDTISYGRDFSDGRSRNLGGLLEELNKLEGLAWVRVLYTYPTRLADELEWCYAYLPKMIPYLDLPLQHLSDPILERMRRGTPYRKIRDHIARLRGVAPDLVVRSTCIVGFPGETEEDFLILRKRFEELGVDHLGVFRYSDEDGTSAEQLDEKVPEEIAERRHAEMLEWAAEYCQGRAEKRLGSVAPLLVDLPADRPVALFPETKPSGSWRVGRWYGQAPEIDGVVYFEGGDIAPGQFVDVRLERVMYPDYLGRVVDPTESSP